MRSKIYEKSMWYVVGVFSGVSVTTILVFATNISRYMVHVQVITMLDWTNVVTKLSDE